MTDLIEELLERVDFARQETARLASQLRLFESSSIEGHFRHTALGGGWLSNETWDVFVLQKAPVPVAARSHAGMIANELRAALDALACGLAERNGRSPSQTYFPISKTQAVFEDDGKRKIKALAPADQEKIIALRPFRGGDERLWALHEADRTRKHLRLGACAIGSAEMKTEGAALDRATTDPLLLKGGVRNGQTLPDTWWNPDELQRIEVGRPLQVAGAIPRDWRAAFRFRVAYSDPPELAGKEVSSTLGDFADRVEEVVKLFA